MESPNHPSSQFWSILSDLRAIDKEALAEFQKMTTKQRRQIGEILVREKQLTMKQVGTLLSIQADEPHMRIGVLAIREGFITEDQLNEALEIQRAAFHRPFELMARDARLDQADLFMALVAYVRFLEDSLGSNPSCTPVAPPQESAAPYSARSGT